jgi:hypothetical protein
MSYILFAIGLIITILIVADLIFTVLSPNGSGFITGKITRWFWRILLALTGGNGKAHILNHAGITILFSLILLWVFIIWLGNTLMFYSDPQSLIDPIKNRYVTSFIDKLYYSGYVLSSMGNGDYNPASPGWKFYVGLISYTGVIYISLSISFLIPVVEGVTLKRKLAVEIAEIGLNPREMIGRHYQNSNFNSFITRAYSLKSDIIRLGQTHLAYPIIHYFHSDKKYESISISLTALDETISILKNSLTDDQIGDTGKLDEVRKSISYYLTALKIAYIEPEDAEPEVQNTGHVFQGLSISPVNRVSSQYENINDRRRLLLAYLQNDGWSWKDMEEACDDIVVPA